MEPATSKLGRPNGPISGVKYSDRKACEFGPISVSEKNGWSFGTKSGSLIEGILTRILGAAEVNQAGKYQIVFLT
jgi:hypothetical protein